MRFTLLAAALAAALPLAGCNREAAPPHDDERPVKSVVAARSSGAVGATYSGEIRARYESKLGFQTSGKVIARLVEVGSHVKRGQPLLRLDPAQQTLQVVAAVADVDAARNRVAQNKVDLQRTEQLLERKFASQAEVDQQRLALAESQSQLKSYLAQQAIKVNQRGYTDVLADRDGVVTAISVETGHVVSPGQPVVTVAADGEREVLVSIPESRVDELRRAQTLHVSVWAQPGKRYHGSLRELAPANDSVTRTYAARIAVKDADAALMLGMTASVVAPEVGDATAVRLPLTAIVDKDGKPQVWIVDPQSARVALRAVTLAGAQNDAVLVSSGIDAGETVVTAGVHMLHAGQRVKMPGAETVAQRGAQR